VTAQERLEQAAVSLQDVRWAPPAEATADDSLTTNGVVQRDPAAEVRLLLHDVETTGAEHRCEVTSRREVPDRVRDVSVGNGLPMP
jgi:hypothetical protein